LFFELNTEIRFRVENLVFSSPKMSKQAKQSNKPITLPPSTTTSATINDQPEQEPPPMIAIGAMNEPGLGLMQWWISTPQQTNKASE